MEIKKFIELLAEQFEETDRSLFTLETKFKNLEEWSSLLALSVIALVDEEYDVALKGDDIRNATTIEDLFNTIKNKI
jgi:acyl carrier protein